MAEVSTKPYLVRAIYEWCTDSGYRPFIAVTVDERTQVPREFVRNGEIVLNIAAEATNRLQIGNELLEFEARFGGVARHVSIPIDNVSAIFAQENGHGMAFEVPVRAPLGADAREVDDAQGEAGPQAQPAAGAAAAQRDGEQAAPAGTGESKAGPGEAPIDTGGAPVDGNEPADAGKAAAVADAKAGVPGRRAGAGRGAKRARKTVLRDVSAKSANRPEAGGDAASGPRDEDRGPRDEDPGPGTPSPRKPRLTRVK